MKKRYYANTRNAIRLEIIDFREDIRRSDEPSGSSSEVEKNQQLLFFVIVGRKLFIGQNLAIPLLRARIQTSDSDFIKEEQ